MIWYFERTLAPVQVTAPLIVTAYSPSLKYKLVESEIILLCYARVLLHARCCRSCRNRMLSPLPADDSCLVLSRRTTDNVGSQVVYLRYCGKVTALLSAMSCRLLYHLATLVGED